MQEITVTSWGHVQDKLFEDARDSELGRFRSRYAFHGLSDINHHLGTMLIRRGDNSRSKKIATEAHKHRGT